MEDLDPEAVEDGIRIQTDLEDAFLGYVRVYVVDPDPTVTHVVKSVNRRDTEGKHKNSILSSLRGRKTDWEEPMNVLIKSDTIDPTCLCKSTDRLANLKPLVWTCPPSERRIEYLSGGHRRDVTIDLHVERVARKETLDQNLSIFLQEKASGVQGEFMADGSLGSTFEEKLRGQLAGLAISINDARLWTLKVYDEGTSPSRLSLNYMHCTNYTLQTRSRPRRS